MHEILKTIRRWNKMFSIVKGNQAEIKITYIKTAEMYRIVWLDYAFANYDRTIQDSDIWAALDELANAINKMYI